MDYDNSNIPSTYDAGREISRAGKYRRLEFFSKNISKDNVVDIIDLGCGTGRFSETLSDVFGARVVGVDPSQKMIDQARSKSTNDKVKFELLSGEVLPFDPLSADMVFMSMVLHHLSSPAETALECHRVLRSGGDVCIRNTVADEISSYPYLDVFPSIRSIIKDKLITRQQLNEDFYTAGFKLVGHQTDWDEIASDWQIFANKIALKADSFVARLQEDEFTSGLSALQEKAKSNGSSHSVGVNVDTFIFRKL